VDIKLSRKLIQDMCGTVSFKRGDSFYRANKVEIHQHTAKSCVATVVGSEPFHVEFHKQSDGTFEKACSCPQLSSFQKDCQHIAAVLLAIHELNQTNSADKAYPPSESKVTDGLLTLFDDKPVRSSGHQHHFENRQVVNIEFIIQPNLIEKDYYLFGVELRIGSNVVENIRMFLENIRNGLVAPINSSISYNPNLQCFPMEFDSVIQHLIQVINDEKMYLHSYPSWRGNTQQLLIPPSSWKLIISFFKNVPAVRLRTSEGGEQELVFLEDTPPLHFFLGEEDSSNNYFLEVKGLEHILAMNAYHAVLYKNQLVSLQQNYGDQLLELNQMFKTSMNSRIPISRNQLDVFLKRVLPGLKQLGQVHIPGSILAELNQTPLSAKLYLDRVSNRLLAGLEFQYENWVINPLEENSDSPSSIVRDVKKEAEILQCMEDGLFAKTDGGYFLHNEELEYEFLYHILPKLQKLVQVYATTAVRNRIYREPAPPQIRVKVKKERTNWLEFKFTLNGIADNQIREVLVALEEKRKFYRLKNGSLLSLETREFEEIQRFLRALPIQKKDWEAELNFPITRGLQLLDAVEDQHTFQFEESFREFLEDFYHPERLTIEVPDTLSRTLRDYQIKGYKWLKTLASYGFGGILADDMGLGKTLQSITYIVSELEQIREKKQPILIVSPASLTYNWLSELIKFAPDVQAIVMDGSKEDRLKLRKELENIDAIIISYPLLRREIKWFEQQSFHTVFFDEAQAFKNPLTQTARAVKRIQAHHRFALTGTPVENSIEELWSIFHVVFPELFLGLRDFSHLTKEKVARRVRPFLLRRMKEEVLSELPEKIETLDTTELLPEQKKLYAAYLAKLREDTLKHLDKNTLKKNRIKILAGLTRLRQICCHPALFVDGYKGSSSKFEQLKQIIEEAKLSGRRVLIFSQFTQMLGIIGREFTRRGYSFFYLDGQTDAQERINLCNRFNHGERDFFLISLKAGGTGLNLTGADTVVLYDLWWNPAVEEQAADRAHRIGQTKVVQVIKLVARGTIEEKMNELQEKKKHLVEEIIDSREPYTLTEDDIREILMV
jgi:SNF2 family DNA or RNA helicase